MNLDGTVKSPATGFHRMGRTSTEDLVAMVGAPERVFGDIIDWEVTTKKPRFGPKATYNTVLPYELSISEVKESHGFVRNLRYQYMENPDSVEDTDNLMYGNPKYGNLDPKTGYLYLGKYDAEQVLTIRIEDGVPFYNGGTYTCLGKPFYGPTTNPTVGSTAAYAPKCFAFGESVSWKPDITTIIYRRDGTDGSKRQVEYWVTSSVKANLRAGTLWRRDLQVRVDAMYTNPNKWMEKESYDWGGWSKTDQTAMLTRLNGAVDSSVIADQGECTILSMEETAQLGPRM